MIAEAQEKRPSRRNATVEVKLEGMPAIHSLESERSLLGAMLSEPETVIDEAVDKGLRAEDFFNPAHQELFRALQDMRNKSTPIDTSTVLQYLADRKLTETVGGAALLGDLAAGVVSVMTAPAHIRTVRQKSILRRLQHACTKIVYDAHERQHDVDAVVDEAESLIFGITDHAASQQISSSRQVVDQALELIVHIAKHRGKGLYSGIPSGFDDLDRLTTGFKGGEMIVLAARPGVGKTALALSMAKNFVKERYDEKEDRFVKPGHRVGIFSLEMTTQQLMLRLLAAHANVSLQKIREGNLSDQEIMGLRAVADEMAELPLFMDESSILTISQLRAKARRMKQMHGTEIFIIDYLQLLTSTSDKARENRQVEVSEISRGIKALALELNVPIIVLSQLNRRPEDSMAEPALHHLRESGSIEQDADVVMLLNRVETKEGETETVQHKNTFATRCKLNIAKQRNGPTDKIDLLFRGECTLFESMPRLAK
ncbi:MAG: replicative DNA helicase [Verrucomicrobiota bacterium]